MSSQLTQQILGLTIGLFNMSAGASYLSNFSGYIQQVQTNWSLTDDEAMAELARALVLSPTFQSQLIGKDTAESRALMVLSHFGLQQESALLTSTIQAINAFSKETYQAELAMLIWGYTKALLFDSQVQALYLDASRLFNQKLSTATVFSVIEANASTHIDTLRDTLTQVDMVDMSSLAQAQSQVLQGIDTTQLPAMSSLSVAALDSELSWSEATLSYSYNTRIPSDYYGMQTDATLYGNLTTGWQTPSAAIRATTDAIMQNINGFIATPITLVTNNGDIRINLIPTVNDVAAFAYYPGNTGVSGDVFIDILRKQPAT